MGNFEKLSVLVIVVIIVMILVVAIYTWQDNGPGAETASSGDNSSLDLSNEDRGAASGDDWDPDWSPESDTDTPANQAGEGTTFIDVEQLVTPEVESAEPLPDPELEAPIAVTPGPDADTEWVYEVKSGDSLGVIAQRELSTVRRQREILALNAGLDPDRLRIGQKLRMPPRGRAPTAAGTATGLAVSPRIQSGEGPKPGVPYTTRGHERLAQISKQAFGTIDRWPEIFALNNKLVRNPNDIPPGVTLKLPAR